MPLSEAVFVFGNLVSVAMFRTLVKRQMEGECAFSPGTLNSGNGRLPESLDDRLCRGQWGSVWLGEDEGSTEEKRTRSPGGGMISSSSDRYQATGQL